jgi:predicted enzyme related to lactoylglutathione lyase
MASIVSLPESFEQRDRWVNFIEVDNLVDTLAKATKNGATVIYQPKDDTIAIISDPNGALLGLNEQETE